MDKPSIDTVRLLLAVIPDVFGGDVFVMKGGTALNLFVHDMTKLSVDIDLAYPAWDTPREQSLRLIADEITSISGRLERHGSAVRSSKVTGTDESELIVERDTAQVKVEVNPDFRGTVLPPQRRPLTSAASDLFSAELSVPSLALDELYEMRLASYCDLVGRRAALRHGDTSQTARQRIILDPPDLLLTTRRSSRPRPSSISGRKGMSSRWCRRRIRITSSPSNSSRSFFRKGDWGDRHGATGSDGCQDLRRCRRRRSPR